MERKKSKHHFFEDDMIEHIKYLKIPLGNSRSWKILSTKLLKLTHKHEINSQKSGSLLYTKDRLKNKSGNQYILQYCQIIKKYLGVILTQKEKDLHDKTSNLCIKKLKKTLEDGKISHAHGSVRLTF